MGCIVAGGRLPYAMLQHVDLRTVCLRFDPERTAPIALKQAVEVGGPSKHEHHRTLGTMVNGIERIPQADRCREREVAGAVDITFRNDAHHA